MWVRFLLDLYVKFYPVAQVTFDNNAFSFPETCTPLPQKKLEITPPTPLDSKHFFHSEGLNLFWNYPTCCCCIRVKFKNFLKICFKIVGFGKAKTTSLKIRLNVETVLK